MTIFKKGQRWVSDTELTMGLGVVTEVNDRSVTIRFPASGEQRTYARSTAPLTRVCFADGDKVQNLSGDELYVLSHKETGGLIEYAVRDSSGAQSNLDEIELHPRLQLSRPSDRIFSGQIDSDKSFQLRYLTRIHSNRLAHSTVRGLTGGRTSLLPHQVYIAHEVARRFSPRVLLADEVGLGKTIEAGLIIHQQLQTERAHRVLIVVPETLVHQWLVEMLRRFNLHFSIFNADRYAALQAEEMNNPFLNEQLVLCSLDFLLEPEIQNFAVQAGWDLLVVDEAHHLRWAEQDVSPEYALVESLATASRGVLLLTATPEQLGKASHFARLRLLDPDRFSNYNRFLQEETEYEPIARTVDELLGDKPLDETGREVLASILPEEDSGPLLENLQSTNTAIRKTAETELVNHLLDRHGTGRVLFRNTRSAVQGFPERQLTPYKVRLPDEYSQALENAQNQDTIEPELMLYPEWIYEASKSDADPDWINVDPRIAWLNEQLKLLRPEKILLITARAANVLLLAAKLRDAYGIHAPVFHEGMTIVERDRAAAFFADTNNGSQILICSEIGSEGRNFQFAHHLILFDLPLNPDLLEQRIGRLDRIGQTSKVQIHVPYFEHSAQEVLFRWYHEGLNAFEETCPVGQNVLSDLGKDLVEVLHEATPNSGRLGELIRNTKSLSADLLDKLQKGRDRLLEINSCRPDIANDLIDTAISSEQVPILEDYLDRLLDQFGVDSEFHSPHCLVLRPSEHVQVNFPGLTEDGMTVTFNRDIALANEDMAFLTWEHPLITWSMDLVLTSEFGNTGFTIIKHKQFKPGTLLLECLYVLEPSSQEDLQSLKFLPPTVLRVVTDVEGRELDKILAHEHLNSELGTVDEETASQIVRSQSDTLRKILQNANQIAERRSAPEIDSALQKTRVSLSEEINRLKALKQVNPNIRDEEISYFEQQWIALDRVIDLAQPRLDALRVVVAT